MIGYLRCPNKSGMTFFVIPDLIGDFTLYVIPGLTGDLSSSSSPA